MNYRPPYFSLAFVFALALMGPPTPLRAQVITNMDALPSAPSIKTQRTHTSSHTAPSHPTEAPQLSVPSGYTRVPDIEAAAPTPPLITPPEFPVQTHPTVPATPVTVVPNAGSHTLSLDTHTLRILFTNNSTDMNADTIAAIKNFARSTEKNSDAHFTLHSVATLPGDDISMPRRIALSRALSVRSLLIQSGIASTRIYPIAQGRPDPSDPAPPDRIDILNDNPSTPILPQKGTPSP